MPFRWCLLLCLFAEPLKEHPTHFELRFQKNAVWIRSGESEARWFRDRAELPVRSAVLSSGRRIYWLPAHRLADLGAAPLKEAQEISEWIEKEKIRTLIWRKRDTRDYKEWDHRLPSMVKTVLVTGELSPPDFSVLRRRWVHARRPARLRY